MNLKTMIKVVRVQEVGHITISVFGLIKLHFFLFKSKLLISFF